MAYSTQAMVQQKAGGRQELVKIASTGAGELDTTLVDAAIRDADAWIDSFAQERYTTPFANPSAAIKRLSAEEAVYLLRSDRHAADQEDHEKHQERLDWLMLLSKGSVSPGVEPGPAEGEQVGPEAIRRDEMDDDEDETVSRAALKGFV